METPPTILANTASASPAPVVGPAKFPVLPLLIAVLVGVAIAALGIGGAMYALVRAGRLPMQSTHGKNTHEPAPVATHLVTLDPLVVNLADAGGACYLKVSVVLQVEDAASSRDSAQSGEKAPDKTGGSEPVVAARDTTLTVLGRQTSDALLAADGKDRLKAELKESLAQHNPDLKVVDVFFTDFLVQK